MLPENIGLMVGLKDDNQAAIIERVLKGQSLQDNLIDLSTYWKIKVWFNKPTEIRTPPTWINKVVTEDGWTSKTRKYVNVKTEHVIAKFFRSVSSGNFCYMTKRTNRRGYIFPSLESVVKYEIVQDTRDDEFKSYEKFAAKFDRRFITDSQIQGLWNSKSAQHGGRYSPSDFHKIGPKGKRVLNQFLQLFVDINTEGSCYFEQTYKGQTTKTLSQRLGSYHHFGRDITIAHTLGLPRVSYSSEYHNCGNGRYGLLANKNEFLWMEDD